jgi:hydrophobe/amphiphile efflux-3 (HAE3) family protein
MGFAARRPVAVSLAVLALAVVGAFFALRLEPSAETETLVGRSTPGYAATDLLHQRFGDDAVYVVVREPAVRIALGEDLGRVFGLEGCLAGNPSNRAAPPGGRSGPCGRLAATKPAKVVFGPGTFINEAVGQINEQLRSFAAAQKSESAVAGRKAYRAELAKSADPAAAEAARAKARQKVDAYYFQQLAGLALRYGLTKVPALNDPQFLSRLIFDSTRAAGTPKARFATIFPSSEGALIQVRLRNNLSEAERKQAIANIRDATEMPQWALSDGSYQVTGAPVLIGELSDSISKSILILLIAAVIVMALVLGIVFRSRLRLLPLAIALASVALTFGVMALSGIGLTMASIAIVPILIGLAVDYAIQLQSRFDEHGPPLGSAIAAVSARGAPTILAAAAATAAGFLVLVLSPVPMIRGFGLLLVVGIALALICALTLGVAAGALLERRSSPPPRAVALFASAWKDAGDLVTATAPWRAVASRSRRSTAAVLRITTAKPGRVLAIAGAFALIGWGLDTQARVESDVQKLVPSSLPALRDLQELQKVSGVGGEVNVVVEAQNASDPAVVAWMTDYQARVLKRLNYDPQRGCRGSDLCPAFSLPDLFTTPESVSSQQRVNALLGAVPPYLTQNVIAPDRKTATLAFGLRLMSLDRQFAVLRLMESELNPPAGVRARLAGLPVLTAAANDRLASPLRRALSLLASLVAVGLVLLLAFRSWRRALIPLVPIALATGWSALILFATRIPLNPLSVVLGTLVVAIATEFSVLLSERYRRERDDGLGPAEALRATYASTGAAVVASGTTAIAGFAVLVLSEIRMLRDFGLVTVIDLGVALVGVLVVLPAVLMLAERGELRRRLGWFERQLPARRSPS